jgi:hypothetical protein
MDYTVEQRVLNRIKNMVTNPTVMVVMRLPEKVFLSYNFDRFIYLKHKDFQGYFFVEKIENFKDGVTPVKVYLSMVDKITNSGGSTSFILLETGDFILMEDGSDIILE